MSSEVVAFLPCRSGSERVPKKNTRKFAGVAGGLLRLKLNQLINCSDIDQIVVSTNDEVVIDITKEVIRSSGQPIKIDRRPEKLASSQTETSELIRYVPTVIETGIVLWTHVTSPFISSAMYTEAIRKYRLLAIDGINDSLMSVTKIQSFFWDEKGPINYDRNEEKWPRTQTLPKWYEVNSGFFIAGIDIYTELQDRIGNSPYLFELSGIDSIDIDWESDFYFAEKLAVANAELVQLGKLL